MAATNFDLTTVDGVRGYLAETEFASSGQIAELSGGGANYLYRARLNKPYGGKHSVIIKHGRTYVKSITTLQFDLSRQNFEVEALKRVRSIIPSGALVTVPEVYLFDEKEHVIIMEDCGEGSVPLKQFMREGRLSPSVGDRLGKALGEFASRLHVWGKDREICDYFDGNKQASHISTWATYGRLFETLDPNQNAKITVLRDPPLEVSPQDLEVTKEVGEKMGNAIHNASEMFVMGDFWPGNMIVCPSTGNDIERLFIVDWEICKPGLPGVEIGQFCAEIGFVRHFHPEYTLAANAVLRGFFAAYEEAAEIDENMLRMAAVHVGTHFVVWGSRLDWGGKDETREVVRKGVRLIVEGRMSEFRLE